ncbi:MAG: hypothetical protein OEZ38_06860 [Gammaproteobacteria bacterium]|nr:hypothetical protein [Gammaproteobacteria bacterium]
MKQRLIASGLHFLASAAVISVFIMLVYFIWYVYPYNIVYSALDVIKIVVGVDLVLGPLLTLVIYNVAKPRTELARDVSIIICFQLVALFWGVYNTYVVRPVFAVYYDGTIYTVTPRDVDLSQLNSSLSAPGILGSATLVYAEDVKNWEEIVTIYEKITDGGKGIMYSTGRYLPVTGHEEEILKQNMGHDYINKVIDKQVLDRFIQHHGKELSEFIYYPLVSGIQGGEGVFVLDKQSMEVVDVFK